MTRYWPMQVIPSYTDDALRESTVWTRVEADKLLRLPAEFRQACEVEVSRRTSRTKWNDGMALSETTGNPSAARTLIVGEILAQLGGAA